MAAIEQLTQSGLATRDLGGHASTEQITEAVCKIIAER
jgi:isocitrate/isopropylmalate dehydrogenase